MYSNTAAHGLCRTASTVTYPLQVIKARMQQRAQSLEFDQDGELRRVHRKPHSMWQTARHMVREEGWRALFQGCLPNAVRVAPSAAITFVVYETLMERWSQ